MDDYKLSDKETEQMLEWSDIEGFVAPARCRYKMEFTDLQLKYLTHFWRIHPRKERARIGKVLFPDFNYKTLSHYVTDWELDGRYECVR